ncbi:uncharacterized protein CLUP02_02598 [Colletotrichum lupini]|uniref:Uncharacterized protein n=1 Tax=Colletotrichum lupini TaxID=145971 RepID=A0A9Q8SGT8_9PEZI|nr:uncharacterized protein CLUP02_02598 [Colletotrichum lupini]UQC77131.1 hypothetical protein CLUP02_02598 [Colletotrichum lupini]
MTLCRLPASPPSFLACPGLPDIYHTQSPIAINMQAPAMKLKLKLNLPYQQHMSLPASTSSLLLSQKQSSHTAYLACSRSRAICVPHLPHELVLPNDDQVNQGKQEIFPIFDGMQNEKRPRYLLTGATLARCPSLSVIGTEQPSRYQSLSDKWIILLDSPVSRFPFSPRSTVHPSRTPLVSQTLIAARKKYDHSSIPYEYPTATGESHAVKSLSDAFAVSSLLYRPSTVKSSTNHIAQSQPLPALVFQSVWNDLDHLPLRTSANRVPHIVGRGSRPKPASRQSVPTVQPPAPFIRPNRLFRVDTGKRQYANSLPETRQLPHLHDLTFSTFGYPQIQLAKKIARLDAELSKPPMLSPYVRVPAFLLSKRNKWRSTNTLRFHCAYRMGFRQSRPPSPTVYAFNALQSTTETSSPSYRKAQPAISICATNHLGGLPSFNIMDKHPPAAAEASKLLPFAVPWTPNFKTRIPYRATQISLSEAASEGRRIDQGPDKSTRQIEPCVDHPRLPLGSRLVLSSSFDLSGRLAVVLTLCVQSTATHPALFIATLYRGTATPLLSADPSGQDAREHPHSSIANLCRVEASSCGAVSPIRAWQTFRASRRATERINTKLGREDRPRTQPSGCHIWHSLRKSAEVSLCRLILESAHIEPLGPSLYATLSRSIARPLDTSPIISEEDRHARSYRSSQKKLTDTVPVRPFMAHNCPPEKTSPIIISQESETPLANIHQPVTRRTEPRPNAHPNLIWKNRLVAYSGRGKDNCPSLLQTSTLEPLRSDARRSPTPGLHYINRIRTTARSAESLLQCPFSFSVSRLFVFKLADRSSTANHPPSFRATPLDHGLELLPEARAPVPTSPTESEPTNQVSTTSRASQVLKVNLDISYLDASWFFSGAGLISSGGETSLENRTDTLQIGRTLRTIQITRPSELRTDLISPWVPRYPRPSSSSHQSCVSGFIAAHRASLLC